MKDSILREVTPLSKRDCFMIFSRVKQHFTFPIHVHAEYELNFIENGAGSKRVAGDSIEEIGELELTLITGSSLEHGWLDHKCTSKEIKEITIHLCYLPYNAQMTDTDMVIREMFLFQETH
ncbi:hypothetical protein GGR21_000189 [Dysgonomonas hofstadii]|uniref:AraC family transcriptional regulator n=1 Tax=Dysgonomonas hofstadii TaxID=637886 RepID=A0A840CLI9_9BACT|nr:hypothetical protein [Dysgonomonas hofstadii]